MLGYHNAFKRVAAKVSFIPETLETTFTAGETLGYPRLVVMDAGKVKLFDPTVSPQGNILGFTLHSAVLDAPVAVQTGGLLTYAGWGLTPDVVQFGVASGLVSDSAPSGGMIQQVGVAVSANSLLIDFKIAIELL